MGMIHKKSRTTGKRPRRTGEKSGQNTGTDFLALGLRVVLSLPIPPHPRFPEPTPRESEKPSKNQRFQKRVGGKGSKTSPAMCPLSPKGAWEKVYRQEASISGIGRISSRQPPLSGNPFLKLSKKGFQDPFETFSRVLELLQLRVACPRRENTPLEPMM